MALKRYAQVLQESCDLLGQIKKGAIPKGEQDGILAHRKEELAAYTAFTTARRRLWRFLDDSQPPLARLPQSPEKARRMAS